MTAIPGAGSERPATYGGPGFQPRGRTHAQEVAWGGTWGHFGLRSEADDLRSVLLALPGEEILHAEPPDEWLFLDRVDPASLRREIESLADLYRQHGIHVHLHRPQVQPPPNFIFQRDLFFMTPLGAVLCRMASRQRAGEERFAAEALAMIGVPILHTVRGDGVFEGADALWIDPRRVLIGTGIRTNASGFAQVADVLAEMGVAASPVELPDGAQHLLGVVNLADRDLAFAREDRLTPTIREALVDGGVRVVALAADDEVRLRLSTNFVAIGPRRVILPAGCPATRSVLERAGVVCEEVEARECVKAAGGPACLTGIIRRG